MLLWYVIPSYCNNLLYSATLFGRELFVLSVSLTFVQYNWTKWLIIEDKEEGNFMGIKFYEHVVCRERGQSSLC